MMDRDTEIPNLRYRVWYSNCIIIPQEIAGFFTCKMAESFILEQNLPVGTYCVKDVVTGKDVFSLNR